MQVRELREYAERRELQIVEEYIDNGVSGSKDSRPALNRLMSDAHSRKFDAVLVWKIDRWGRSLKHLVTSLAELDAYGVAFISLRDNLDLSTPSGRLMMQLLGAMAEFERALIQERVRRRPTQREGQGSQARATAGVCQRIADRSIARLRYVLARDRERARDWHRDRPPRLSVACQKPVREFWHRDWGGRLCPLIQRPFWSRADDPQLQRLNANIAKLAATKPAGEAFGAFALAAHLADLAVGSALELGQMPG
jgi:DNA invertase Pin-like site-specific DNA recombinase